MNTAAESPREHLEGLRNSFDENFAAPLTPPADGRIALVAIRAGGEPLALRADQVTGIVRPRQVVPVPSRIAESMGLAGIRGTVVPVFSLAELLGLEQRNHDASWLALALPESPIALAFDDFEGQVQVERADVSKDESSPARRHVRGLVRIGEMVRTVIDVASLVEAVRNQAGLSRS